MLGLIGSRLALRGRFWETIGGDALFTYCGVAVIGLFTGCWVVSALVYKWRRYDAPA